MLASASPRRQELLQQLCCSFRVLPVDAAEEKQQMDATELVLCNAGRKASAGAEKSEGLPVLGADTVVWLEGDILGKPRDAEEARFMLERLSGRCHEVLTGIAFAWQGKLWTAAESTKVFFAEPSSAVIEAYIASGEPLDKAGAYGIQGKAAAFIKYIEGSYSNVVGLPLYRTVELAKEAGVDLYDNYGARSSGGRSSTGKAAAKRGSLSE